MELPLYSIYLVYLFYGAVFFAIGVAVTSRHEIFAQLRIAGMFHLLALFAFLHALHEWLELFFHLDFDAPARILQVLARMNLLLASLSFFFLFLFGISLHAVVRPQSRRWFALLLGGLVSIALLLLVLHRDLGSGALLALADFDQRKLIGFPATIVAGSGVLLYARTLRGVSRRGAAHFSGAGVFLMLYGVFAGLVPSQTLLAPWLPVEACRGLTAFAILHCLMYGLDIFHAQREAIIADRLRDNARLERLGALGRLAAGVAHEVNNPLANASLQLELLQTDPAAAALPEKSRERLRVIGRNLDRSAAIARELLQFSSGRSPDIALEPVDLAAVVAGAWELLGSRTDGYSLRTELDGVGPVPGVPGKLEDLFRNLLGNALDATGAGGVIEVRGRRRNGETLVTVRDHGAGIVPELLDRIMEPFFTTKGTGKGTGLGLAICYGIMELHGGRIEVASRPGEGTSVSLTFPAPARSAAPS